MILFWIKINEQKLQIQPLIVHSIDARVSKHYEVHFAKKTIEMMTKSMYQSAMNWFEF